MSNLSHPRLLLSIAALITSAVASACGAGPEFREVEESAETAATVRALTTVKGSLAYGETSAALTVSSKPGYSALRFDGWAGDQVRAVVRSTGSAKPLVWIADSEFRVLTDGQEAIPDPAGSAARVTFTLPKSTGSTFYLLMRTYKRVPSTLSATLDGALPPAGCDEDNPVAREVRPGDFGMAGPVMSFIRSSGWSCMHREWHDVRMLSFLVGLENLYIAKYHPDWSRVDPQEGAKGNGLEFLAMHRAMLGVLRATFASRLDEPGYQELKGWDWGQVPRDPDFSASPVPEGNPRPFDRNAEKAIANLEGGAFSSDGVPVETDDEFGIYVETKRRPVGETPWLLSRDVTAGIHNHLHGRFNDPRSPVRMGNFSRNLESRYFWLLHGWLDAGWSRFRLAHGKTDLADKAYLDAMNAACRHMTKSASSAWSVGSSTCTASSVGPAVASPDVHHH